MCYTLSIDASYLCLPLFLSLFRFVHLIHTLLPSTDARDGFRETLPLITIQHNFPSHFVFVAHSVSFLFKFYFFFYFVVIVDAVCSVYTAVSCRSFFSHSLSLSLRFYVHPRWPVSSWLMCYGSFKIHSLCFSDC